ncbi:uncharacterized protein LOC125892647 isoform X2 [Epinephelus fuscoguttatus]|uniref:uncharacterized protein LOC125892647 isoform X2 n=1 Tax=Epinephelus fuscoguttatus TaxID=293821 RepID=UPI0020D133BD|nr:uncharacterized protein LOC125892647 isoform X2 [Epinephelus fuscoguttatus]
MHRKLTWSFRRDMPKKILSEMHHSFTVMKWGLTQQMFLYVMVSGTLSQVTVHQSSVLTAALGRDVTLPCHLSLSNKVKMVTPAVLYWYFTQDGNDNRRLWFPSDEYMGRVNLLETSPNTLNKSIRLKNVQWADSGKYQCKVSVTTEKDDRFRRTGNETLLLVYETMMFNLTSHNDSLLSCEVNVTRDAGLLLSISHNGCKLQPVDSAPGDAGAALPFTTLSETVSLRSKGEYECQLQLNKDLITKSIFLYHPPVARDGEGGEKNVSRMCPSTVPEPGVVAFPEPWLLYMAVLLVPFTTLLILISVLLMYRC